MHPYVLIPLVSGVAAAVIAGVVLMQDSRHRAHRLVAALLACSSYWSFLEVIWNSLHDPEWVPWLVRASSLGWMPLGALCVHLFLEVGGDRRSRLRRRLPVIYGFTAVSIGIYVATPWGIAGVVPTSWGWSLRFGPLYLVQYVPVASLAAASLAVLWRRVYPRGGAASERRQGRWVFAAVAIPLVTASTTDALLPYFGVHVPRLGSASMTLVGATVAWSVLRYGYSLLAPSTFAPQILGALRDGVALVRRDGIIRVTNTSLARLCGCAAEDLVGCPLAEFLPSLAGSLDQEIEERECQLVSGSGHRVEVSVASAFLRDRQGEPVGQVLSVRDVSEVVAMRTRLMMSGRLSAVGELAAGIAHEINNPIAYVRSNLNQLASQWSQLAKRLVEAHGDHGLDEVLDEGQELIQELLSGVTRIAGIVEDVRGFAHAGRDEHSLADLNALLDETLRMAELQLRHRARVDRRYGEIPPLACNPQALKQVFLNVVINASHAVEAGGCIAIETRREDSDVMVSIQDDGCGMSPEVRERIFDPFFTTKKPGEGMGLGLFLAYQMVRRQGGDIAIESEPGRGTCVRIRFPLGA